MFTDNIIRDVSIGCGWSIIMTIGFIGWGSTLLLCLKQKNKPEWLKATLGVAILTILGTILDYFSISTRVNLLLLLFLGIGAWIITGGIKNLWNTLTSLGLSGVALLSAATYVACLGANLWMYDANWDDASGYLPVCHEMSVSGQSWAPLSLRRILAWGGQYPLQMLGMLFTSDLGGAIYDRSVGAWITLLFVLNTLKTKVTYPLTPIAGLFLILFPQTGLNTAPAVIPAFLLCSLYTERKNIIIGSVLIAAIALTRSQLVVPTAIIGMIAIYDIYNKQGLIRSVTYGTLVPMLTLLFCLASMLLHKQIYGTYSVFLTPGPLNANYISFMGHWEYLTQNVWSLTAIIPELTLIIGIIIIRLHPKMAWLSLITIIFFLLTMPEYSVIEFRRYSWPVITAATFLAFMAGWPFHRTTLTLLLIAASYYPLGMLSTYQRKAGEGSEETLGGNYYWQTGPKAQTKIPKGRSIIWISGQPALLDYSRNKIINWDSFPAVGQCPTNSCAEDWRDWGAEYKADWLVTEEFTQEQKNIWIGVGIPNNLNHYTRVWYPDRNRAIDTLKKLESTLPTYKYNGYVFYDLRPKGSPFELDIPQYEIKELKEEEKIKVQNEEKWMEIERQLKNEQEAWMKKTLEAQEKRDQARTGRNLKKRGGELDASNNHKY